MRSGLAATSGLVSTVALLLPWYAPYWLPGVAFGVLVSVPAARQRERRWVGQAFAVIGSLLAWLLAWVSYLGTMAPPDFPFVVWIACGGAVGGAIVTIFVTGVIRIAAWKQIGTGCLVGGLLSLGTAFLWQVNPVSGWPWLIQMAASMTLWQVAMGRVLTLKGAKADGDQTP